MLVDINLLPEKVRERSKHLIIALSILGAALLCWTVFYLLAHQATNNATALQQQVTEAQDRQAAIQSQLQASAFAQEKTQLATTVQFVEEHQYETVPLMTDLVHALPERGFFQAFTFTSPHDATLEVQFDDKVEAAHYLTRMQALETIESAQLLTLEAEQLAEEDLAVDVLPRYVATYQLRFVDKRLETAPEGTVDPDAIDDPAETEAAGVVDETEEPSVEEEGTNE